MAKKVVGTVRLQIPAGAANPAPPVGPSLGQAGVMPQDSEYSFEYLTTGDSLSFFGSCFFFSQENLERREVFGDNAELKKGYS